MISLSPKRIAAVVLPIAVVGLVVLAWRQAESNAETDAERAVQRSIAAMVALDGLTGPGDQASVTLEDGRFAFLSVIVRFHCTPEVKNVLTFYNGVRLDQATDSDARGVLRLRHRHIDTKLPHQWHGVSDLDVDAHYDGRRLTGTASARLELKAGDVRATCRSDRIRLGLAATA
jgi:hypothetical protein